jgi:hypothetical protein
VYHRQRILPPLTKSATVGDWIVEKVLWDKTGRKSKFSTISTVFSTENPQLSTENCGKKDGRM